MRRPEQHGIGDHDIQALECRQSRQEVPVRRAQTVTIERLVSDGDDHVTVAICPLVFEQALPDASKKRLAHKP